MCAPPLANTRKGEWGQKKYFRGGAPHRGGGLRHATHAPFVLCTLYFPLRFYLSMQNCTLLHFVF